MLAMIHGIHHVTAIGGDPIVNRDFYTRVLGLRLIKRTVNFDDPSTWHLYFGDRVGSPGTIMTFFPHPQARAARPGHGEIVLTRFAIPPGTLADWRQRLEAEGAATRTSHLGERPAMTVHDPHGTRLMLVETTEPEGGDTWSASGIAADMAIRAFESVRMEVRDIEPTAQFLEEVFGLTALTREGDSRWFDVGRGQRMEVAVSNESQRVRFGAGAVHHVAFRVPDDEAQAAARQRLIDAGFSVTDVLDRQYFRSIYFREPGGVIFEIATDGPGFDVDEPESQLGRTLKLPPWLEPQREAIERSLPPLTSESSS